jgi:transposase
MFIKCVSRLQIKLKIKLNLSTYIDKTPNSFYFYLSSYSIYHLIQFIILLLQTKPELLSKECKDSLPKKQEKKEKKLTKEEKVKADRRKKIRNKAAKMARGDL